MRRKSQKGVVYRITVDEKLSDDLFRFVLCALNEGRETFIDRDDDWQKEEEILADTRTYHRAFHTKKSEAPGWGTLEEGQVYLSGEFEPVPSKTEPDHFQVSPGRRQVLRIDRLKLIDDGVKALYSDALGRR